MRPSSGIGISSGTMNKLYLTLAGCILGNLLSYSQEIIPFPDLSGQYQLHRNGGKALDDRNYAIFSEDYRQALAELDEETDRILLMRRDETDPERIEAYNARIEDIRKKKKALLSEAELVEDLQKFY